MSLKHLCTWNDAKRFMSACTTFNQWSIERQREVIEMAMSIESPLELVMLCALKTAGGAVDIDPGPKFADLLDIEAHNRPIGCLIEVAVPIGKYRADMVLRFVGGDAGMPLPLVIECDGFDYHDRTRDQACRDRARDRYMQRYGYLVARFAGDEIVEQPFACAMEAIDMALCGVGRVNYDKHPPGGWPVLTRWDEGDPGWPPSLRMFDIQHGLFGGAS